jgi:DNA-binding MarR family transcriptional regulator
LEFPSFRFRNDADASTGLLFIRTYNKWHTIIKNALRNLDITHPQFVLLTTLNYLSQSDANVTQASISKMADMDAMSVSQIIRGLEGKGYLTRTENPNDTRANAVQLLPKGIETVRAALPVIEKIDEDFFGILADEEEKLRGLLFKII